MAGRVPPPPPRRRLLAGQALQGRRALASGRRSAGTDSWTHAQPRAACAPSRSAASGCARTRRTGLRAATARSGQRYELPCSPFVRRWRRASCGEDAANVTASSDGGATVLAGGERGARAWQREHDARPLWAQLAVQSQDRSVLLGLPRPHMLVHAACHSAPVDGRSGVGRAVAQTAPFCSGCPRVFSTRRAQVAKKQAPRQK